MSSVTSQQLYILRTFSKELNVLMLLIFADVPMGVGEIARLLGRQEKTIRGYLENLSAFNLVGRQAYQEGWIALGGKQLVLGEPVKNTGLASPTTTTTLNNDSIKLINDSSISSSSESLNENKPVKNTGLPQLPEKIPTDQEYRKLLDENDKIIFDLLRWYGLGQQTAAQFAISNYEVVDVIALIMENNPTPFLIHKLKERDRKVHEVKVARFNDFINKQFKKFIAQEIRAHYGDEEADWYLQLELFQGELLY